VDTVAEHPAACTDVGDISVLGLPSGVAPKSR
jgi:hypothetical protein